MIQAVPKSDTGPVAIVRDLDIAYRQEDGTWSRVLHDVDLDIGRSEIVGLCGESGCGKSTLAYQLLGFRRPNSRVEKGTVIYGGRDLLRLKRSELDRLRGDRISLVPQNPTTALSPGMRVGRQMYEVLERHGLAADGPATQKRIAAMFEQVGLPDPDTIGHRYPHQLSGGQQQRVCIAMALVCEPDLVVLDEPTTGLDVTTQQQIIMLLSGLQARLGMSMLYVTHDLNVLAEIADRVGVMYAGQLVEVAPTAEIFDRPKHPYTQGLIGSMPMLDRDAERRQKPLRGYLRRSELPPGCPFAPRCDPAIPSCAETPQVLESVDLESLSARHLVACQLWRDIAPPAAFRVAAHQVQGKRATPLLRVDRVNIAYGATGLWAKVTGTTLKPTVYDATLTVAEGEVVAVVGESGSGKSTLARAITGLVPPVAGRMIYDGKPLSPDLASREAEARRSIQYIFQNPDASLNPRATVRQILARPLKNFFTLDSAETERRIRSALDDVRLDTGYADRYPDQLSGGERQRIAIARALVAEPRLLICDEVLSALDVSVQASVIQLLIRLRAEHNLAMLFISHDLAVVREISDRVIVMHRGRFMETKPTEEVFLPPHHPYTASLLAAVPRRRSKEDRLRRQFDAQAAAGYELGIVGGTAR